MMKPIEKLMQAVREWISEKPWEYDQVVKVVNSKHNLIINRNRDEQVRS